MDVSFRPFSLPVPSAWNVFPSETTLFPPSPPGLYSNVSFSVRFAMAHLPMIDTLIPLYSLASLAVLFFSPYYLSFSNILYTLFTYLTSVFFQENISSMRWWSLLTFVNNPCVSENQVLGTTFFTYSWLKLRNSNMQIFMLADFCSAWSVNH